MYVSVSKPANPILPAGSETLFSGINRSDKICFNKQEEKRDNPHQSLKLFFFFISLKNVTVEQMFQTAITVSYIKNLKAAICIQTGTPCPNLNTQA